MTPKIHYALVSIIAISTIVASIFYATGKSYSYDKASKASEAECSLLQAGYPIVLAKAYRDYQGCFTERTGQKVALKSLDIPGTSHRPGNIDKLIERYENQTKEDRLKQDRAMLELDANYCHKTYSIKNSNSVTLNKTAELYGECLGLFVDMLEKSK